MLQLREMNGIYIAHDNYRHMMDKMVENEKEIQEKTSELIALKEEMDKKKNLFDEVEKNMIYKSREIQRVKEELEVKEFKLSQVNDMLKETLRDKEEQEHLVSKHIETEVKLNTQAKKLQTGCDEIGRDLEKLHDKLDSVNEIETANDAAKDSFMLNIEETVEKLASKIEKFGRENEMRTEVLMEQVDEELSARQDQINGLITEVQNLMSLSSNNSDNTLKELEKDHASSSETQMEVLGAVERSTKNGKSVMENYVTQILPNLNMIAKKVQEQAECLQKFSANINEDLSKIRSDIGKSVADVVQIVDDTEGQVKAHFEQEEKSVSQLKGINNQVVASEQKLRTSVDLMMTAYKEHYDEIGQLNAQANGVIKELAERNLPLKQTVEDNVFQITTGVDNLETATNEHVEEAKKKTKTSVEESEEICEEVKTAKNSLKTSSSRFFKESVEIVENSQVDTQKANSNRIEIIKSYQTENKENSEAVKRAQEHGGKVIVSKLNEEIKSSTGEQLGDLKDFSKEKTEEITEELLAMDEQVVSLVWEDMKVYQPTGETPVRTERHYPRYLASTEPHHRILDKFRKTKSEEVVVTPLEESVDSELSYSLENENKSESISGKRELKKPEVIKKNILKSSNQ